jgi:hypothetical protein
MSDFVTWSGWVATFLFGGISMWQWLQSRIEKSALDAHRGHLLAVKQSLRALRASCTEAIEREEVIKSDPARAFIRQVAYHLVGAEGHIDAALGKAPVTQAPLSPSAQPPS